METRSQKKQEEQLTTLFAKLEEQTARQEQFYQPQSAKLEEQAALCREQNEKWRNNLVISYSNTLELTKKLPPSYRLRVHARRV